MRTPSSDEPRDRSLCRRRSLTTPNTCLYGPEHVVFRSCPRSRAGAAGLVRPPSIEYEIASGTTAAVLAIPAVITPVVVAS